MRSRNVLEGRGEMQKRRNIDFPNLRGETPLHMACAMGNIN